jgi:hypothetical protein
MRCQQESRDVLTAQSRAVQIEFDSVPLAERPPHIHAINVHATYGEVLGTILKRPGQTGADVSITLQKGMETHS